MGVCVCVHLTEILCRAFMCMYEPVVTIITGIPELYVCWTFLQYANVCFLLVILEKVGSLFYLKTGHVVAPSIKC